jgi:hypothetical protein
VRLVWLALMALCLSSEVLIAAAWDPAAPDYSGHKGKTFYVSKLGDNSDGSNWQKAFRTIQAALLAVPDDQGGHQVIVRPDTYLEANLYTDHKGAAGAYNLLVGDADGKRGSGATGRVIIDSSDPEKRGFKSYDWWCTMRSFVRGPAPQHSWADTFSGICWDRWIVRNLYAVGGDAGVFWDLTVKSGQGFTVIVEDCVGIGRAFGGGLGYPIVRKGEPSVFRRCYFLCLDWQGDAGAFGVGAYNTSPPADPDAVCEDCSFVGPDNAVQILFPNKYVRLKLKDCRLISLCFGQPEMGTLASGVISSAITDPKQVHIDFEDCILAGYSLFGTRMDPKREGATGQISFTTKGKVRAYVQFKQPVPQGFERLSLWPAELYDQIAPPRPPRERDRINNQ